MNPDKGLQNQQYSSYNMAKKEAATAPALSAELLALVQERDAILQWLKPAQTRELEIRAQLAASLCPSPVEGVNRILTADGYEVTVDHKVNRKLDEAALDSVMPALDESYRVLGVLVQYKPSIVMEGLRTLPAEQLKIFQQAITETPGTPALTIKKVEAAPATPIMDAYHKAKAGVRPDDSHPGTQIKAPAPRVEKIKKAAAKAKAAAKKGKK
jgi:hypothetical protein